MKHTKFNQKLILHFSFLVSFPCLFTVSNHCKFFLEKDELVSYLKRQHTKVSSKVVLFHLCCDLDRHLIWWLVQHYMSLHLPSSPGAVDQCCEGRSFSSW